MVNNKSSFYWLAGCADPAIHPNISATAWKLCSKGAATDDAVKLRCVKLASKYYWRAPTTSKNGIIKQLWHAALTVHKVYVKLNWGLPPKPRMAPKVQSCRWLLPEQGMIKTNVDGSSRVAVDAARTFGRLAAASAISTVFQVCSTWQAISRSNNLWQRLTREIWHRDHLMQNSWHQEYIFRQRLGSNFRTRRVVYTPLEFNDGESLTCLRLALSDYHIACGFVDGAVRLFDLTSKLHVATFRPQQRDILGRFSRAVSGIVLSDAKLVFASLDGDVHLTGIHGVELEPRRVQLGNVVSDGTLVDFTGCSQWWVGLYAGVPARSFHVWNAVTEELMFIGGSVTDPESVTGWHLLTELNDSVGRIRMSQETAIACTGVSLMSISIPGNVLGEQAFETYTVIVDSFDMSHDLLVTVDNRRMVRVVRVSGDFEEVCKFRLVRSSGSQRGLMGCMNGACVLIWSGGVIRAWGVEHGEFLHSLPERVTDPTALIADDRFVAAAEDGEVGENGSYTWFPLGDRAGLPDEKVRLCWFGTKKLPDRIIENLIDSAAIAINSSFWEEMVQENWVFVVFV
ncbi:hypothetical protein IFM89_022829 [Coptis chinensis]|uniref:Transcriptional regulator STERILE APETALA n=1 Tax=Coptis chinensis TaxID=261450 RepID=A0A835GXP0_9MAGN|nr:hypothetical protein IFM89_022829 [Coptis chinensis]